MSLTFKDIKGDNGLVVDILSPILWKNGERLSLEAVFRNGNQEYVFRWKDNNGAIRVIEHCRPQNTSFYHEKGGW